MIRFEELNENGDDNMQSKINLVIIGFLVLSLILNGVLLYNLISQNERFEVRYKDEISEKNKTIKSLKTEISNINISNDTDESAPNSELELQTNYKKVAGDFVKYYLEYSSNNLSERRNNLLSVTDENLVEKIAPEVTESTEERSQLSSDPIFISAVKNTKVYISETNNITNSAEAFAEVTYKAKGSEGETEVNSFIHMHLKMDDNGSIKVNDFNYYPRS